MNSSFGVFSGVDFNVDASRGLNGVCDFLVTKSLLRYTVAAPILSVFEAKNDNPRNGLGQCIAAMVATQTYNQQQGSPTETVYGCATTGNNWLFMKLQGTVITLDIREYHIRSVGKIVAIIKTIVDSFSPLTP